MNSLIRSPKDFYAAMIYLVIGVSTIVIGRDYQMGTAFKMGPAYFPTVLAALLCFIGLISLIRSGVSSGLRPNLVPFANHHVGEGELGELGQHQSTTGQPVSSTSVAATRSPSPAWLTLFGSGPGEWSTASFFVGHPRGSRN